MNADSADINKVVARCKLLDGIFLIFQSIVAEIAVTIVVIPLGSVGMSASITYRNDYESELRKTV